ncbi:hypothetical protein [Deinococcus maricopensis]|uniref:Uncharacterized protein n=1 Tax=Deinococcus maricopensis (strain DSM 21211 / LMG 22137 / NRRL B-23946 / LB-34) TaxID=709986 RepID=E8U4D0_DEIML|nr:hypothetical protein [Deinococcus maricopensis]ADV65967.1 hypothetical protein Deima_0306 [Deinococcus maricopensis DSM 21211]
MNAYDTAVRALAELLLDVEQHPHPRLEAASQALKRHFLALHGRSLEDQDYTLLSDHIRAVQQRRQAAPWTVD